MKSSKEMPFTLCGVGLGVGVVVGGGIGVEVDVDVGVADKSVPGGSNPWATTLTPGWEGSGFLEILSPPVCSGTELMAEDILPGSVSPGDLLSAALEYVAVDIARLDGLLISTPARGEFAEGDKGSGLLSTDQFRRFMNVAMIINETDERITTRRRLRIDQNAIIRQSIPHNTVM